MVRRVATRRRIGKTPVLVIDRDEALTDDEPVGEGDDARAVLELSVRDESRHESFVDRADVTHRGPHLLRGRGDGDFLVNRSHWCLLQAVRVMAGSPLDLIPNLE